MCLEADHEIPALLSLLDFLPVLLVMINLGLDT